MASEFREYTSPISTQVNPRILPATGGGGVTELTNEGIVGSQSLVATPTGGLKGLTAGGAVTFTEFSDTIDIVVPNPKSIEPRFTYTSPTLYVVPAFASAFFPEDSGVGTLRDNAGIGFVGTRLVTSNGEERKVKVTMDASIQNVNGLTFLELDIYPQAQFVQVGNTQRIQLDLPFGDVARIHVEDIIDISNGEFFRWVVTDVGNNDVQFEQMHFTMVPVDSV